tara:strand:- start:74 stop:832 length:759 start_codon:yes stop_codon:yes gene_type:complete
MSRTILLDGDITVYQLASKVETPIDFGDGLWVLWADEKEAVGRLEDYLENLKTDLGADRIIVALSDTKNFRKYILPSYKENRKLKRKPMILPSLRQYMVMKHDALIWSGLEGDDVLGIYGSEPNKNDERIIVSMDKDMKTVPCKLYNTKRPEEGIKTITEEEADYWHLFQTLTGDVTDGYSGCPSVGEKTAKKILGDNPTWETVVDAYIKRGLTEDEALIQARVARILRFKDYDFVNNKPILWESPNVTIQA